VINHPPAFLPYSIPSYSNIAYLLLGLAYETITGETIDQGQRDIFNGRLGMLSTTPRPPDGDVDAIIPHNESYSLFHHDLGILSP
jgi:CubicO group peptidase (beta-lactamase class C family)